MSATLRPVPGMRAEDLPATSAKRPSCHAATALALPDGTLLASWYAGTEEKHPDVAVLLAARAPGGVWDAPETVVDTPGRSEGNPVLGLDPSGRLWLFFVTMDGDGWKTCRIRYRRAEAPGAPWSADGAITDFPGWMIRCKPVVLPGDRWLLPAYDERTWEGFMLLSTDAGEHFAASGRISAPRGLIQPTLLPRDDGRILALLRSRDGWIWRSLSADGGQTWAPPQPTVLPNPNSGIDAVRLGSGAFLLVYNDSNRLRSPLVAALSDDGGDTWGPPHILVEGPGEYSYPAVVEGHDGEVHVLYTHERRTIRHLAFRPEALAIHAAGRTC